MQPWHETDADRWAIEVAHARSLMTNVVVGACSDGRPFIDGDYTLLSRHGYFLDRFRFRIQYPAVYPREGVLPEIFLLSHRDKWQRGRESHIETSWRLCLFVVGESLIHSADRQSLLKVFAALHTFLLRERIYQGKLVGKATKGLEPRWPGQDRAHDIAGLVEAVNARGMPGWNAPCPCGSGKKYKKCHGHQIERWRRRTT